MFMLNSCTEGRGQEWVLLGGKQGVLLLDLHHQVAEAFHPKQLEEAGLHAEEGKLLQGYGEEGGVEASVLEQEHVHPRCEG